MTSPIRNHVRTILWVTVVTLLTPTLLAAASAEENKEVVLKYLQAVADGKTDGYEPFFTADTVGHDNRGNLEENPGAAMASKAIARWEETFDGYDFTIHDSIASGDKVAVRFGWSGNHKQLGKKVSFVGMLFFRLEGGKIAESWVSFDELGFRTSLGYTVTPPAPPAAEEGEEEGDG